MMENVVLTSSRKTVVCRYFAASGTCFYGNDCQFLHSALPHQVSISPTFQSNLSFSSSSHLQSLNSPSESIISKSIENRQQFSLSRTVNTVTPVSLGTASQEGLISQRTQELSLSSSNQQLGGPINSSPFEVLLF